MQRNRQFSSPARGAAVSRVSAAMTGEQFIAGAWLFAGAVIAAWMLCLLLPVGMSPASASANHAASYSSIALPVSNVARKGDRLDRIPARAEVGGSTQVIVRSPAPNGGGQVGVEPVRRGSQPGSTSGRKLPVGCEPAFSKLATSQILSARCVTSIDGGGKPA